MRCRDATGRTARFLPNPLTFWALTAGIKGIPTVAAGTDPDGFGARTVRTIGTGDAWDPLGFLWVKLLIELITDVAMQQRDTFHILQLGWTDKVDV
jgi:hypothetical protein